MTQSWLRTVIDYHRLIVLDKAEVRSLFYPTTRWNTDWF